MSENTTTSPIVQFSGFPISDFDWIVDKNLLRDEGIYFGLSDGEQTPTDKIDAIRQFFQERIKTLEKDILARHDFAATVKQTVEKIQGQISDLKGKAQKIKDELVIEDHDFGRALIGLLIYGAILIFNFWLIYSWLNSAGVKAPVFTALGVYLFGSLSLFGRFSLLYYADSQAFEVNGEQRERWKVYLEELFIPFIASVYISYQGAAAHAIPETLIFFLLIYCMFLFSGKGMLNQFVRLRTESAKMMHNIFSKKKLKIELAKLDAEISTTSTELAKQEEVLSGIKDQILDAEKAIAMIHEQRETNVSLFLSEYELAKSARQTLNRKQISQIISSRQ